MIDTGLISEVQNLLKRGYNPDINSLNTVGYKEVISFLNGEIDLTETVRLIKRNTRHYAKRQITWFRKDNRIKWLKINNETDFSTEAKKILDLI